MNRYHFHLLFLIPILFLVALFFVQPTAGQTGPGIRHDGADTVLEVSPSQSIALESAMGGVQTRFVFRFLNTRVDVPLVSIPAVMQERLDAVGARVVLRFANTRQKIPLGILPQSLATALDAVEARVVLRFANTVQVIPLVFPHGPFCETVSPEIDNIVTENLPDKQVAIRWITDTPTTSVLEYGNTSGQYSTTMTNDLFATEHEVILSNIEARTYYYRIIVTDVCDNVTQTLEQQFSGVEQSGPPLVLIYAVLDNNLGDDTDQWQRLITNVEAGAQQNSNINVRLLIDSPDDNNAYVYAVTGGEPCIAANPDDPTCNGRYVEGTNFWRVNEDTAHPESLYAFIKAALDAHPDASQVLLSLVGHGSGWTAGALPSQPSSWGDQPSRSGANQEQIGGLLWDDTTGTAAGTRALSTKALGVAFQWVQANTGRQIDLLYLDACSMGMAEVADEIAEHVHYLLASPNTAWASFTYDKMLGAIKPEMDAEAVGLVWRDAEKKALEERMPDYPYTFSLYDLSKMDALVTAVNKLVTELNNAVSGQRGALDAALNALERYESDYDGEISSSTDHYGDLGSFLTELQARTNLPQSLVTAITDVQSAIDMLVVGDFAFGNGKPHTNPDQEWAWQNANGVGLYFPRANDPKRSLYTGENLRWMERTGWDQFLNSMGLVVASDALGGSLPICASTRGCDALPVQLPLAGGTDIYLPLISR